MIFTMALCIPAYGEIVYTTFPGPAEENGGSCFGGGDSVAVGINTVPSVDYKIDRITVHLQINGGEVDTPFEIHLFNDASGLPGAKITTIGGDTGTWSGNPTFKIYNITPLDSIILEADTAYWIVIDSSDPSFCAFGWNDQGTDPAGSMFVYLGEARSDNGDPWFTIHGFHQLEIEVTRWYDVKPVSSMPEWAIILLASLLTVLGSMGVRARA
jgi:hypothetical protein